MARALDVLCVLGWVAVLESPCWPQGGPVGEEYGILPADLHDLSLSAGSLFRSSDLRSGTSELEVSTLGPSAFSITGPVSAFLGAEGGTSGGSYIVAKAGPSWYLDSIRDLSVGLDLEAYFGFRPIPLMAIEIGGGYIWAQEDSGGVDVELWGVPVMANVMVVLPILALEPYAGVGGGGLYASTRVEDSLSTQRDESFVFAWSAFAGLNLALGPLSIGVEGKYFRSQEISFPGSNPRVETFAVLGTVGLHF